MRYGAAASTSREMTKIADSVWRKYAGPNMKSATAATATAPATQT